VNNAPFDLAAIRAQFPILSESIRGRRLAYLDNGATTQKPLAVLERMDHYYRHENSNVHRAVHELASRATSAYEASRDEIARYFNTVREGVIFTRGTTESINLVARSFVQPRIEPGDEVLVSTMEHHSNIVPWQLAGAKVIPIAIDEHGTLDLDDFRARLNPRTRLVAVTHVSNTLGTVNPIKDIIDTAHAAGVPVLIDGAQGVPHARVDFAALDADFYAMSAHKAYGPTGFGVLLAKLAHLEAMPPLQGGGDMIDTVAFEGSTWNELPYKFEAGTPDMAGAIGFAEALRWMEGIGLDRIVAHEHALTAYGMDRLQDISGLRVIGTAPGKTGILSFVMDCAHPHDIGSILDEAGVAVRTGHHCTMPLMKRFNVPATARASLAIYNGEDDIDQLVDAIQTVKRLFS